MKTDRHTAGHVLLGMTRRAGWYLRDPWCLGLMALALMFSAPLWVVLGGVAADSTQVWDHIWQTVLGAYVSNTAALMVLVAVGSGIIGSVTAWLVSMYRFYGRRVMDVLLVLPLSMPAYVTCYVYVDLFDPLGSVYQAWQTLPLPSVSPLAAVALLMTFAMYPYVYLAVRVSLLIQSPHVVEVSRTLGCGPWQSFWRAGLPVLRPAIAGGMALVMMEAVGDLGAVTFLGLPTVTVGIFRTWLGMGSLVGALKLSAVGLVMILAVVITERVLRGGARYTAMGALEDRRLPPNMTGVRGLVMLGVCFLPVLGGFLIPLGVLIDLARQAPPLPTFWQDTTHSLILGSMTAVLAVTIALVMAFGMRLRRHDRVLASTLRLAISGYAVPGAIIAAGAMVLAGGLMTSPLAHLLAAVGIPSLVGSLGLLVYAYLVRFLSVSYNIVEAALTKVSGDLDGAVRTLGRTTMDALWHVHTPLLRRSLIASGLLVFVDVVKELPTTLILRPFNFDTLAVRVYQYAGDERLIPASHSALMMVALCLLPVSILVTVMAETSRLVDPRGPQNP